MKTLIEKLRRYVASRVRAIVLISAVGATASVMATTYTWTPVDDSRDWSAAANWQVPTSEEDPTPTTPESAPTSGDDVVFPAEGVPEGGWVVYIGGNAQANSVTVLGDTTLQREANITTGNGCIVVQESVTTGETPATLKLNSAFIFAGSAEQPLTISCPIVSSNGSSSTTSGFTSNVAGTFAVSSTISGTGTFEFRKATTLSHDLVLADEGLTKIIFQAAPTFTDGAALTVSGSGTLVCEGFEPSAPVRTQLKNSETWSGVCELKNVAINNIDAANYGNSNSTVRFNGASGYMRYSSGSTTEVGTVKCIDLAGNGLTLNNGFSSGVYGYKIAAKITGSGPMHFGTRHNDNSVGKYFLTGDMSEFTGAIDFGSLTSYRPAVIIKTDSEDAPSVSDYGQIIIAAGRTGDSAPKIAATWNAPGGFVIYGEAKMASGGSITSDNGVAGSGELIYEAIPTATPTFCEGLTSSGTGRDVPAWTGKVVLAEAKGSMAVPLAGLGVSGSKIVVNGFMGNTTGNSVKLEGTDINATVELAGNVRLQNANDGETYTFAEVTGSGNFAATLTGTPEATNTMNAVYAFTKLSDYTGELSTYVRTDKDWSTAITIGTVAVSSWTLGQKMVDLSDNCNLTTSPGSITVEVNGSSLGGHYLFKATDGDLYVIAAQVTVDETTTYFATLEEAAEFALANDAQIAKIDPAVPTELPGWSYAKGYFTKLDIAQVGETTYKTLAAAIATGTTDDIVLINDCAETVTLGAGQTIKPGAYAFSGVLKGEGTIYYAAKPTTVPTFEGWTGTFVADWDGAHATSFPANDYGILGSVVEVRKLGGGFVPIPGTENVDRTVFPTISIPEGCFMKLANGYGTTKTVFTKVTGAGAMTNNTKTVWIETLENFTGTISSDVGVKIGNIVTSADVTPGTCLVKGGTFTDVASTKVNGGTTYPLSAKTIDDVAGLYFDPVVYVRTRPGNEVVAYYNALADAVDVFTGENNREIVLLKSTDEFVTLASGTFVRIEKGDFDCDVVKPAEGCILTQTGTRYDCAAAVAYVQLSEGRKYYGTVNEALNEVGGKLVAATVVYVINPETPVVENSSFTYDEVTNTYTLKPMVAQYKDPYSSSGNFSYTSLAEACTEAKSHGASLVTLLVARDQIDEVTPSGWHYNTPAESSTDYGTLTTYVPCGDGAGNSFKLPLNWNEGADIGANVKPAGSSVTYGQAYALGLLTVEAGVATVTEPVATIAFVDNKPVVTLLGSAKDAYTVTCTLKARTVLGSVWEGEGVETVGTGSVGSPITDNGEKADAKFYKVFVTITDK